MDRTGAPENDAWHEAGHAVVAHLLGGRVRLLTLEAEDERLEGHAAVEWSTRDPLELARLSGLTALGGPLAELLQRGVHDLEDPDLLAAWEADEAEIERAAALLEPDPAERIALIRGWIDRVRALLDDPHIEELVARVADALDAHGTLDEALFEDCLR